LRVFLGPLRKVARRIAEHLSETLRVISIAKTVKSLSIGGGNEADYVLMTEEVLATLTRAPYVPHPFAQTSGHVATDASRAVFVIACDRRERLLTNALASDHHGGIFKAYHTGLDDRLKPTERAATAKRLI
jgi:hypothetical protein